MSQSLHPSSTRPSGRRKLTDTQEQEIAQKVTARIWRVQDAAQHFQISIGSVYRLRAKWNDTPLYTVPMWPPRPLGPPETTAPPKSAPPLPPPSEAHVDPLAPFTATVLTTARALPKLKRWPGNKVLIFDIWIRLRGTSQFGSDIQRFKQSLLQAHHAGLLTLDSAPPHPPPHQNVDKSRTHDFEHVYHFVALYPPPRRTHEAPPRPTPLPSSPEWTYEPPAGGASPEALRQHQIETAARILIAKAHGLTWTYEDPPPEA